MVMTERLKAAVDDAARLPLSEQDKVAEVLQAILDQLRQSPPAIESDVYAAIDRAMTQHAATLDYLRDN
ncbi:MAG TPA: hypothetical protein VF510_25705 [Ktedonobacterales bacterium]